MVFVESVYWGDELGARNITKSFVATQVKDGKIDTVADERLIPAFESNPEVKLETQDEKEIREEAVRQCGEANQSCLKAKISQLQQERLHEKEKIANSSANIIQGNQNSVAGDAGDSGTADDTISFVANQSVAGDRVHVVSDGTSWFAYAISRVAAGITFTQAS